jgi:hypothetical protein
MVMTPSAASRIFMPATKSLRSGTWASTLLPSSRSAGPCSAFSRAAVSRPKNSVTLGMPFSRAAAATFAAGSTPSTGMPMATKCWSR